MRVGIVALQGGVSEHAYMVRRAARNLGIDCEIVYVKHAENLNGIDALILPGGESTTIGALMARTGLLKPLKNLLEAGETPVLATCAGAILLAKRVVDKHVGEVKQPLLAVMDFEAVRNYFGRQRESFETPLRVRLDGGEVSVRGVFIRAPAFTKVWGRAESISDFEGVSVAVREGEKIALAFHPELTSDTVIHEYLLRKALG
ncbi:MAG: pyridoxal 5'-phosphate synthase glutaminase subunit PdxT [Hyperthermus sp.]|nr:MAG: pyridoxal 5'-phosphate synthase glutaminase subunit PdxT [Hyperthermus sp.]